jgi:hypothetical protein
MPFVIIDDNIGMNPNYLIEMNKLVSLVSKYLDFEESKFYLKTFNNQFYYYESGNISIYPNINCNEGIGFTYTIEVGEVCLNGSFNQLVDKIINLGVN